MNFQQNYGASRSCFGTANSIPSAAMACTGVNPGGPARQRRGSNSFTTLGQFQGQQQGMSSPRQNRQPQQVGRRAASNMYAQQQESAANSPVMVKITAAQLASASNAPNNCDRKEAGLEGAQDVKYIPLSWEDILGKTGMNGMRVSMMPSADSSQNQQLKVSFGGQTGCSAPGETPLKVVSFQPVSRGRVDRQSSGQNTTNYTQMSSPRRSCSCSNCRR